MLHSPKICIHLFVEELLSAGHIDESDKNHGSCSHETYGLA